MNIIQVIDKVDSLYPSRFTTDEKLDWCYELSAMLRSQIKRVYEELTANGNEYILLDDIMLENVYSVSADNRHLTKVDYSDFDIQKGERHFVVSPKSSSKVKLVYLTKPTKYNTFIYEGTATFNENTLTLPPQAIKRFEELDTAFISVDGEELFIKVYGVDTQNNQLVLKASTGLTGEKTIILKRMIDDLTQCDVPFDAMYIDWLFAKIAFYQNDFEVYNQNMAQFNSKLNEYEHFYKQNMPLSTHKNIHSIW